MPQTHRDYIYNKGLGEETKEYYYLYVRNHPTEEWIFRGFAFRVLPSGAVMKIDLDTDCIDYGEMDLQRIDRQELEEFRDSGIKLIKPESQEQGRS